VLNKFINGITCADVEEQDACSSKSNANEPTTPYLATPTATGGADRRSYAFGVVFEYDVNHRFSSRMNANNYVRYVPMKYASFKEEIVSLSAKADIALTQWLYQYKKADLHFTSFYCRAFVTKHNKTYCEALDGGIRHELQIEHLLALMFYCNYDLLQYEFSKTYRRISPEESNKQIADRHSCFWHLGKWIKEAVHHFGTRINSSDSHGTFYTGISQMVFSNACYGYFNTPLSTTTDVSVAACFANENGLIVELSNGAASYPMYLSSAKYFAMHWLSRYSSEHECLFLQCADKPLIFKNILCIQHSTRIEYRSVIQSLRVLDDTFNHHRFAHDLDADALEIAKQMVLHQLRRCTLQQSEQAEAAKHGVLSLDEYGRCLFDEFCKNQRRIWIDWHRLTQHECGWIPQLFVDESGECINFKVINALFPNLECVHIRWKVKIKRTLVAKILRHLQGKRSEIYATKKQHENTAASKLVSIRIAIDRRQCDEEMVEVLMDEFQDKFEMIGFIMYRRANQHDLCIERLNVNNFEGFE